MRAGFEPARWQIDQPPRELVFVLNQVRWSSDRATPGLGRMAPALQLDVRSAAAVS
jgi:hypothetical protein